MEFPPQSWQVVEAEPGANLPATQASQEADSADSAKKPGEHVEQVVAPCWPMVLDPGVQLVQATPSALDRPAVHSRQAGGAAGLGWLPGGHDPAVQLADPGLET